MKWNKSDYGQIEDIRIPPKYIWKPDLLMYNRLYTAIYKVTANNKVQQVVDYNLKNKTYVLQHNNLLHFSADEAFDGTYHTNVIVTSEGM